MDPKASAKSKRSHTQHGRRTHPPPAAIAHKKKAAASASAAGEKTASTHGALPSNWDRYDNTNDDGVDTDLGTKQSDNGEVAPKSKGADFGYLIEQARSQPKDFGSNWSQGSSSFDDFSFDFMRGASSMLSVRGKDLLSLCEDDNFIIDDDPTSSSEVPLLSMDLHALSAQLSRLKLSQRLFIEADLLPEESNVEESQTTSASKKLEIPEPAQSGHGLEPAQSSHGLDLRDLQTLPVLENTANDKTVSNSMFKDGKINKGAGAEMGKPHISPLHSTRLEEASKNSEQIEQFSRREVEEPIMQIARHSISNSELKKSTKFEAASAEAELDMLLDSFSETNLCGSIPAGLINESSAQKSSNFGSTAPNSFPSMSDSSENAPTSCIDDSIDDLLDGNSLDDQMQTALPLKQESFPQSSGLGSRAIYANNSVSSKATSDSIGDSLDDLLSETSVFGEEQICTPNQQIKGTLISSKNLAPQTTSMGSKAMDDFDSWLDEL